MKKRLHLSNACICGNGIVGRATAKLFGIIALYDILPSLSNVKLEDLKSYEYIFVSLPTPTIEGKCQTKPISDLIETIEGGWYYTDKDLPTYIIRSTVPPGTADQLMKDLDMDRIISNPEFLSQDTADQDIENPFAVVIGGKNQSSLGKVRNIYRQVYRNGSWRPQCSDQFPEDLPGEYPPGDYADPEAGLVDCRLGDLFGVRP